jgi:hypothetical protein
MESFFAVILWIATLDYVDEAAFRAKPLADILLDQKAAPNHIVNAKNSWFKIPENFKESITAHFEQPYRKDKRFRKCLIKLRKILYPVRPEDDLEEDDLEEDDGLDKNANEETGDADPMKEGVFRMCMKEIDDFLHETKGCDEMQWIDSNALAQHTPEGQ